MADRVRDTILGLLPQGKPWVKTPGSSFFKLAEAIQTTVDQTYFSIINQLSNLLSPIGSTTLGGRWADELGVERGPSLQARLKEAERLYTKTDTFSITGLRELIQADSGITPKLQELWPNRAGVTFAGNRLRGEAFQHVIIVDNVPPSPRLKEKVINYAPAHVRIYFTTPDGTREAII